MGALAGALARSEVLVTWLVLVPVLAFVAILAVAVWIDRRSPAHPSQRPLPESEPNALECCSEVMLPPADPDAAEPTLVSTYAHARELPESWEDETIVESPAGGSES